ncbi:uncharacterized protein [Phaseolus vulgaris]|uniref:uncharacterized protein n=1 Tax=Phaseolus vulgaris TaxID=3885 RepID=UPI0035CC3A1C
MMKDETLLLKGEMSEMLRLMKKTFYSNEEIFLRELINNASNALDKIQFEVLMNNSVLNDELIITLIPHKVNKTLSIIDNGIGMTKMDLVDHLGIGFYSAYLVAEKIILTSKHNDHDQYTLESQPSASFIVTKDINVQQLRRGTKITLFLKDNQLEYLQETTIKNLISKHCKLITHPIYLWSENNKDHWSLINIWLRNQEMYDKFVAQKLENHLPDDLAFSILSKLPLKSLKRYGCLHKSWALFLENSNFMELFRINFISNQHYYYDNTSLLLCLDQPDKSSLFSLSGRSFQNMEKVNWPKGHCSGYFTLGSSSINGILCLHPHESGTMCLWNPSSSAFKIIPPSPIEYIPDSMSPYFSYHGFGYNCARDDYKVIRQLCLFPSLDTEDTHDYEEWDISGSWEIYSLRSNSWRKPKSDIYIYPRCGELDKFYLDGMCHWLGDWRESYVEPRKAYLVSFDLSNEVWFITPLPHFDIPLEIYGNFDITLVESHLFLLNGSIALISNYYKTTTFSISILVEIGKKETWTKLVTLGPLPYLSRPIGIGNMSNILFRTTDGKLAWLYLRTHLIEKLDVNAHGIICQLIVYKENLFPTKGINS